MENEQYSSGVQDLISRLSKEGVEKGKQQAEAIVDQARHQAEEIVAEARRHAEEIEATARQTADQYRVAGEDALRLACRDAIRDLASQIHEGFRQRLQRLIAHTLKDDEIVKRLILEVAGKAAPSRDENLEILLPAECVSDEEVRRQLESGELDGLTEFVQNITGDAIREGIHVGPAPDGTHGLQIRVVEEDVQIELSDETITNVIADHVLPRFRGILRS